jgi:basic membrane protein A
MKKYYITALLVSLAILLAFSFVYDAWTPDETEDTLKVGFIYENDGSTPFTYSFMLAQQAVEREYPDQVHVLSRSNVRASETEESLRELVKKGCAIIFINNATTQVRAMALEYPQVQFCQISVGGDASSADPANYHTFSGEIYQARYVSGVAAGMKLKQMIKNGAVPSDKALVGFVGAFPTAEVISGYTAFLLGLRSEVPTAKMKVRYTNSWSNYIREKAATEALIQEGCAVIAQHTNTTGPAVACEEAADSRALIHVGYNQSMIDLAPSVSLLSVRINWTPYITGAVGAVMAHKSIEKTVDGRAHGNDMSAGLDKDWVEILELNQYIAAKGTSEKIAQLTEAFRKGSVSVFKGNYTGTDPSNPADTIDLRKGYIENENSSAPSFHYVLDGVIEIEN